MAEPTRNPLTYSLIPKQSADDFSLARYDYPDMLQGLYQPPHAPVAPPLLPQEPMQQPAPFYQPMQQPGMDAMMGAYQQPDPLMATQNMAGTFGAEGRMPGQAGGMATALEPGQPVPGPHSQGPLGRLAAWYKRNFGGLPLDQSLGIGAMMAQSARDPQVWERERRAQDRMQMAEMQMQEKQQHRQDQQALKDQYRFIQDQVKLQNAIGELPAEYHAEVRDIADQATNSMELGEAWKAVNRAKGEELTRARTWDVLEDVLKGGQPMPDALKRLRKISSPDIRSWAEATLSRINAFLAERNERTKYAQDLINEARSNLNKIKQTAENKGDLTYYRRAMERLQRDLENVREERRKDWTMSAFEDKMAQSRAAERTILQEIQDVNAAIVELGGKPAALGESYGGKGGPKLRDDEISDEEVQRSLESLADALSSGFE